MIRKTAIRKNPYIGLFLKANDEFVLVPKNCPPKVTAVAEETLGVEPIPVSVNQSPLIGIFSAMNSNACVLSALIEKEEVTALRKTGLNLFFIDERWGAVCNNVLMNDKAALVNPAIPESEVKKLGLGIEVFQQPISGIATIGSVNVVTNKGVLAYNEITDIELKGLEKMFGVKGLNGSVNMGLIFNSLGVVANSKGALVGELTSGFEIQRIYEALFG
ncbi:translation initiation factor IF-6 [Candidatus Micrarchaeota archaeon]|nr:translation initiation factor IF-6 [Candidatus Micrarchaeota archaeon]